MTEQNVVGVDKKENLIPVFKADIMETEEARIQPVGSLGDVSPLAPVSAQESSIDAVGMWRKFSERLRARRLNQGISHPPLNSPTLNQNYGPGFQDNYENDEIILKGPKKSEPFLNHLVEKVWFANLQVDPELLHKLEEDEYKHPDDGIVRVCDLMNKEVICVIDSTPLEQVAAIFNKKHISGVPVVHYQSKHLEGIITMSDILFYVFNEKPLTTYQTEGTFFKQESLAVLEMPVRNLMKKDVVQIGPDATIQEACETLIRNDVHRLIVTKKNKVRGIITTKDITEYLARNGLKK
jgi:CBS domain-containing protein